MGRLWILLLAAVMMLASCQSEETSEEQLNKINRTVEEGSSESSVDRVDAVPAETQESQETYPEEAMKSVRSAYYKGHMNEAMAAEGYETVIGEGMDTINYCREKIEQGASDKLLHFYEWMISITIRAMFPEALYAGRAEYYETTLNADCATYAVIGDREVIWSELKEDTLIQVMEMLNMDWCIAHRVSSAFGSDQTVDGVSFIIERQYFDRPFYREVMGYEVPRLEYLQEFNLIAVSDEPSEDIIYNGYEGVEIPVYDRPTEEGTFIGYVYAGDLLRPAMDDFGQSIVSGDWTLVDIIPFAWCINSNSAWIPTEHLAAVTEDTIANAGYVLAGTPLYEVADYDRLKLNSVETDDLNFTDPFRYGDVYCIRIMGEEGDFYSVSDMVNGNVFGYVPKEDVFFYVDDDLMEGIRFPEPDLTLFINTIQDKIRTGACVITSRDLEITYDLTEEERDLLAEAFTSVSDEVRFDGGIRPYREAVYPYVQLDLGDGTLTLAEGERLLLEFDQRSAYRYGIGTRQMPIVFLTPNQTFLDALWSVIKTRANDDKESMVYLLNADALAITGGSAIGLPDTVYDQQVHINHGVRAIMNVLGKPLDEPPEKEPEHRYIFSYSMPGGELMEVVYEDDAILFNGQWYRATEDVTHTVGNMFAAYF